jgi:hypothetical protein
MALPLSGLAMHHPAWDPEITARGLDALGDQQEGRNVGPGKSVQPEVGGGAIRHPRRDRQAALGELNDERRARLLACADRTKSLPGQRVERVVNGNERVTGIVSLVPSALMPRERRVPALAASVATAAHERRTVFRIRLRRCYGKRPHLQ